MKESSKLLLEVFNLSAMRLGAKRLVQRGPKYTYKSFEIRVKFEAYNLITLFFSHSFFNPGICRWNICNNLCFKIRSS